MSSPFLRLAGLALLLGLSPLDVRAQEPPDPYFAREPVFESFDEFLVTMQEATGIEDPAQRAARLDELFTELQAAGQVPYAQGRKVAFLYRGPASGVAFPGDHTGWSPSGASGTKMGDSDVWMHTRQLLADSRVDYKIVRDGSWILDPRNPLQVWSGFGPNSELRMPEYRYPMETVIRPLVPKGSLSSDILIQSSHLGYSVKYRWRAVLIS